VGHESWPSAVAEPLLPTIFALSRSCPFYCSAKRRVFSSYISGNHISLSSTRPMSARRFTTSHDAASLRLHASGSRVPTSDAPNVGLHRGRRSVRDAQNNWIATEPAGLPVGAKGREQVIRRGEDGVGEEVDIEEEHEAEHDRHEEIAVKKRKARKRARVHEDPAFLGSEPASSIAGPSFSHEGVSPAPTSASTSASASTGADTDSRSSTESPEGDGPVSSSSHSPPRLKG
jgi:hypothetical protein